MYTITYKGREASIWNEATGNQSKFSSEQEARDLYESSSHLNVLFKERGNRFEKIEITESIRNCVKIVAPSSSQM